MTDPRLAPPVQLVVRCTVCAYERTIAALHQGAVDGAFACEKCREPNRILAYRPMGPNCTCCMV